MCKYFLILLQIALSLTLTAQEYNYVHYDTKNGLAGSHVYSMCQDNDGFIWFGTDYGLSRFDGKNFKTYTVKDGLPDNDVLELFTDTKNRVWIGTFSSEVCYYQDGKIHNSKNDSLANALKFNSVLKNVYEVYDKYLVLSDTYCFYIIDKNNSLTKFNVFDLFKTHDKLTLNFFCGRLVISSLFDKNIYTLNADKSLTLIDRTPLQSDGSFLDRDKLCIICNGVKSSTIDRSKDFIRFETDSTGTNFTFLNTYQGAWQIDTQNKKLGAHFLPTQKIPRTFIDKEKNIWFGTIDNGVFKLPSLNIKNVYNETDKEKESKEIFSIAENDGKIYAGSEHRKVLVISKDKKVSFLNKFEWNMMKSVIGPTANSRVTSIKKLSDGSLILVYETFLVKLNQNGSKIFNYTTSIKSVSEINKDYLLVGTAFYAFKMRTADLTITDTIWNNRTTKVLFSNNNYYIGTLHGLYEVKTNKTAHFLGTSHNSLSRRISNMLQAPDGIIWVATSDAGITGYRSGKIICNLTDSNGLSSNICKALFLQNNFLWVGANKGINKIDISKKDYPIVKYSSADGLPSDIINSIYIQADSTIWIGSPAGLTYFKEKDLINVSICNLVLESVIVSGKKLDSKNNISLKYNENNILFQYAGISLKSGGEITYKYKLTGLNDKWETTTSNTISYPTLPPGKYELQLYAINKFNKKSDLCIIKFYIAAPFWKTGWFIAIIIILTLGLFWAILQWRFKLKQQKVEEKNKTIQQIAEMEQLALQAQMNPHFIFNCLNSIQQFIMLNDKEKANKYLTQFASLIRSTFENSIKKNIRLSEEIQYLNNYLQLEQLRYADNFTYAINIDPKIEKDFIEIPAMLLQPYVENALRHGIHNKIGNAGKLDIIFVQQQDHLECTIRDNGIGRAMAEKYKSNRHIEYQSKGMSVTGKRIELLNTGKENKIEIIITDLIDNNNNGIGTEVVVKFPLK
ncbi:histidine kinase [Ferruginibacter lapsinanis]|uniref:sensor histidine kinase n=1 Tax=Ferruginibacter lapsinanis TaxID=563172 RepID=UPI001E4D4F3F|nr:sensor histidine kinase [Ferruginibacter lapsinanis]UEG48986.1 histidine kinase [Ferruginibacter lapsinanis]